MDLRLDLTVGFEAAQLSRHSEVPLPGHLCALSPQMLTETGFLL